MQQFNNNKEEKGNAGKGQIITVSPSNPLSPSSPASPCIP